MRINKVGRLAAYTIFLGTSVSSGSVAMAQTAGLPPPPVRSLVDENGVDLATGALQPPGSQLTIGSPGAAGLTHVPSRATGGWLHGFVLVLAVTYDTTTGVYGASVTVGGKTSTFTLSGGSYTNDQGDGATLTTTSSAFTYTGSDGTVVTFDRTINDPAAVNMYAGMLFDALGSEIDLPSGEIVKLYYKHATVNIPFGGGSFPENIVRLQSVTTNLGYQLKYEYATNGAPSGTNIDTWAPITKVTGINNAVDYCNPTADTCSGFTQSWPNLTYSSTTIAGGYRYDSVTDSLGRVLRYKIDFGYETIVAIKKPSSSSDNIFVTYDSANRVASVSNGTATWSYGWSLSGTTLTATATDPLSHQRVTTADTKLGVILTDTDALSRTTSYTYDTKGRLTRMTAPEGNYVNYTYDARGNLTQTTAVAKSGSGLSNIVTSTSYDTTCTNLKTCNKPNSTTDALGRTTSFTYDSTHGGLLTVTSPAVGGTNPQTRYSYTAKSAWYKDSSGTLVGTPSLIYKLTGVSSCVTGTSCTGTVDEIKTTVGYGGAPGTANNLLPTAVTTAAGDGSLTTTTTTSYDSVGNVTSADGPLSGNADTTSYFYDADRELTMTVGPDPDGAGSMKNRAAQTAYNADGQPTTVSQGTANPDGTGFAASLQAVSTYDTLGRKISDTVVSGSTTQSVTQYSYDAANRPDCAAQRMNPSIFGSLPTSACSLGATGSFGPDRISKNIYDAANQILKVQVGYGTGLQQDTSTATYTNNGKVATTADANGNLTTYVYDGFDRPTKIRYPSSTTPGASSTTDYEELVFDAGGNVTSRHLRGYAGDSTQHIDYTFDVLNRLTLKDLPGSEPDVSYTYDLLGRMTGASQTGNALTFGYDALGRTTSAGGPLGMLSYQYDLAGRRIRMTWPDGFYVTYDHLVTGEVSAIRENGASSGIGVLATFAYDDMGRRTSLTRGNGTSTTYAYDTVSRLSSLALDLASTSSDGTTTLSYSPANQIVTRTRSNTAYAWTGATSANRPYMANGLNQYTASGSIIPTYDNRGNLTSAGATTYSYSSENLLTSTSASVTLSYDPTLQLYQTVTPSKTVRYQYDGSDLVAEYNGSNTFLRRYVHGPGTDEPLVAYEGSGTTSRSWYLADERSSIVATTDDSGNPVTGGINSYDEYGIPGNTNGRFMYTGQVYVPALGMYNYKARIYSPTLGRFLQSDPIGYGDGPNMYAYTHNDPINGTDPSGTDCWHYEVWYTGGPHFSTPVQCSGDFDFTDGGVGYSLFGAFGVDVRAALGQREDEILVTAKASYGKGNPFGVPIASQNEIGPAAHDLLVGPATTNIPTVEKPDPKKTAARNHLACQFLADHKYNVFLAWQWAWEARDPEGPVNNWSNDNYRNAENFLYAAYFGWSDGAIWAYQNLVKPIKRIFGPGSSPYSVNALQAGYDGNDHFGQTKAQLAEWCKDK